MTDKNRKMKIVDPKLSEVFLNSATQMSLTVRHLKFLLKKQEFLKSL